MIQYVDTSVIGRLVLEDDGWAELRQRLARPNLTLVYSDFGLGELASAVGKSVRRGLITSDFATALLDDMPARLASWTRLDINSDDIVRATQLVSRFVLALRMPDAIHIAVAERIEATITTADIRQHDAAVAVGVTAFNPTR